MKHGEHRSTTWIWGECLGFGFVLVTDEDECKGPLGMPWICPYVTVREITNGATGAEGRRLGRRREGARFGRKSVVGLRYHLSSWRRICAARLVSVVGC